MNLIKTFFLWMLIFSGFANAEAQNQVDRVVITKDKIEECFQKGLTALQKELTTFENDTKKMPDFSAHKHLVEEAKGIIFQAIDVCWGYLKERIIRANSSKPSAAELMFKNQILDFYLMTTPKIIGEMKKHFIEKEDTLVTLYIAFCEAAGLGFLHKYLMIVENYHDACTPYTEIEKMFSDTNKLRVVILMTLLFDYAQAKSERLELAIPTEAELAIKQSIITWYHENARGFIEQICIIIEEAEKRLNQ